ncbi:MAG TPA: hypothetical protein VFT29_15235 [Gemmatimonadaceae bacterium]|nr:hypothetical protein [Gemmatimonadaceae bacterium]
MRLRRPVPLVVTVAALVAGTLFAAPSTGRSSQSRFPHDKHARVFPLCTTCHAGVVEPRASMWPEPARCASCHDGVVKPRVEWRPRTGPRAGNRRFTHEAHSRAATAKNPADSLLIRNCSACHVTVGAPRMTVQNAVVRQCFDCHGLKAPHVDVASDACATCHVRLTDAPGLTRDDIRAFPRPQSHDAKDFVFGGHGRAARVPGGQGGQVGIAASCATCHSRNLCVVCHVNAPESPVIRALTFDDRAPVYALRQPVPASHAAAGFLRAHGRDAQRPSASCATCHARESCASCHVGVQPRAVAALPAAAAGRASGAQLIRVPPASHTQDFKEGHAAQANARPTSCETCHARSTCLECHRPDGAQKPRYHLQGFLTRHPSAAFARAANCSDCHNPAQFCQTCHQQAGLVATSRIGRTGYHDAFRGFSLGHGQAARQSLESCASCHAERDCTACHSAVGGGFRFNPHGPGFDAARMRSKNPSVCVACHGRAIPGGR